jgi:hypothetical protein
MSGCTPCCKGTCDEPRYLKSTCIHDIYVAVYAKSAGQQQYKWYYPLFTSCPSSPLCPRGMSVKTIDLTLPNGLSRRFWYYQSNAEGLKHDLNLPVCDSIPIFTGKPCGLYKPISSSEHLKLLKQRNAFRAKHSNIYAKFPMDYTNCYHTLFMARKMCVSPPAIQFRCCCK